MEEEEDTRGPYEEIEELMQPKVKMSMKQEIMEKMLIRGLTKG